MISETGCEHLVFVGNADEPVFKAPRRLTRLRERARTHMRPVGDFARARSRITSLYRSRSVQVSGENVYGVRQREAWQKQLASSARTKALRLYAHLDILLS